jgi:hypothetical protein
MLSTHEQAAVVFPMRAKLFPALKGQGMRIRQAAGRPDVAHAVSQPNRRDLAHLVAEFPKKARKLLGAADGVPIQLRRPQLNLLLYELLRSEDIPPGGEGCRCCKPRSVQPKRCARSTDSAARGDAT